LLTHESNFFFSTIRINALYEQCGRMPTLGTQLRSSNDSSSTTASTTSTSPEHALHALSLAFAELTSSLHDAQHTARVATEEYLVFCVFCNNFNYYKKQLFPLRVTVLRSQLDELKLRLVAEFEKRQQLPSPAL
jgi:ammonia channel protein AmtB